MKFHIALLFIVLSKFVSAQKSTDYIAYHKLINKAETQYFLEKNVEGALKLYDSVFSNYDFIFLKDILNAAQISYFEKRLYRNYIKLAFSHGFKPEGLANIPLFQEDFFELLSDKELRNEYKKSRKTYVEGINKNYVKWIYKFALDDQVAKSKSGYESFKNRYLGRLFSKIKLSGFPGEQLLGVDDSLLFAEQGHPEWDLHQMAIKKGKDYFATDDASFTNHTVFPFLVHEFCSYQILKEQLYDEMKKGKIHPREIGMLYDNMYRVRSSCNLPQFKGYFRLNTFMTYPKITSTNRKQTDVLRTENYIVSLAVDEQKLLYEKEYGFKLFYCFFSPHQLK